MNISTLLKCASVLAIGTGIAGCAADGTSNVGTVLQDSFNRAANKTLGGQQQGTQTAHASSASYTRLTDTKLNGLFAAYPVRDDMNPPAFPKVAIRIDSFSRSLEVLATRKNTPDECVSYSIVLWMSETKSERFDNLRMCAGDLVFGRSFLTVSAPWAVKMNYNKNSGQVRGVGPIAPKVPYPSDSVARNFLGGYSGGGIYLGSIFSQLGYDWEYPHDTMRVWVSSVTH